MSYSITALQCQRLIIAYSLLALFSICSLNAQQESRVRKARLQLGFNLSGEILPPLQTVRLTGSQGIHSSFQSSFTGGLAAYWQTAKRWSVESGIRYRLTKLNFESDDVPGNRIATIWYRDIFSQADFPLAISYRLKRNGQSYLTAGASLHIPLNNFIESYGSNGGQRATMSYQNNGRSWLSYQVGTSRTFILSNANSLVANAFLNYSPKFFFQGNYMLTNSSNGVQSTGNFRTSGTGMGISVTYLFSAYNKRTWKQRIKVYAKNSEAQDSLHEKSFERSVLTRNHFIIEQSVYLQPPARLKRMEGSYPVSSTISRGTRFGIQYRIRLSDKFRLNIAPSVSIEGKNFMFSVAADSYDPALRQSYHSRRNTGIVDGIAAFGISAERLWLKSGNVYRTAGLGLQGNFSLSADYESISYYAQNIDDKFVVLARTDLVANNDLRLWISIPFRYGFGTQLNNLNLIEFGIAGNIPFSSFVYGEYYLNVPGRETVGSYKKSNAQLGLYFNYILTRERRRVFLKH